MKDGRTKRLLECRKKYVGKEFHHSKYGLWEK